MSDIYITIQTSISYSLTFWHRSSTLTFCLLITTSNLACWIVHTERYLSKGKTTRTGTDVICPNIINFRECWKRHKIHSILFFNFLLPSRQCKDIKVFFTSKLAACNFFCLGHQYLPIQIRVFVVMLFIYYFTLWG